MRWMVPPLLCLAALAGAAQAEPPLRVTAVTAEVAPGEAEIAVTGIVDATRSFSAGFPSGGQIISVAVDTGALVYPGDLLAELDPTQAREALRAAEAALRAADASLLRAEQEVERDRQLNATGYLAQAVLDQAEEALVNATSARAQAEAQVETARKALTDTGLLADRSAVVTARNAEPGQVVAAAQSVLDLAEVDGREAVFIAPADFDLSGLIGRRILLRTLEPPERQMAATIHYISAMIDSGTGGVVVKAALDPGDADELMLHEPVAAALPLPLGQVAALPAAALTRDAAGPAVWLIGADGTVTLHPVEVARYATDRVFLSAGLTGGEVVVVQGANLLYPGRRVEIIAEAGQ